MSTQEEQPVWIEGSVLCVRLGATPDELHALTEAGLLPRPIEARYLLAPPALCTLRRTLQIRHELAIDLAGAAVVAELVDQLRALRAELRALERLLLTE
ncbi:MAG: chaperone modulator CbpM [Pseudomonadota bacterium]|nr:chaperone modulator CbpM [Pseudomonadota bacterium]HJO35935.1 chaperone modulator CbpM [Gammaproteobacteria bacterium]